MKATPIIVEEYPRNEMSKANKTQTDDKLKELIDHFAELHKHEHLNEMVTEGEDIGPKTIQSPRHMNAEHIEAIGQIGNRTKDKEENNKQMHNQENCTTVRLGWIIWKWQRLCYYQDTVTLTK